MSAKAQEVLDFIIWFKTNNDGLSPTYREIMHGCGFSSTSTVAYHVDHLITKGLLTPLHYRNYNIRGLMVPGGKWTPPANLS